MNREDQILMYYDVITRRALGVGMPNDVDRICKHRNQENIDYCIIEPIAYKKHEKLLWDWNHGLIVKNTDKEKITIYMIVDIVRKKAIYIGKTDSFSHRIAQHRYAYSHENTPNHAIRLYSYMQGELDNYRFIFIENAPEAEWQVRERFWIDVFDTRDKGNVLPGGIGKQIFGYIGGAFESEPLPFDSTRAAAQWVITSGYCESRNSRNVANKIAESLNSGRMVYGIRWMDYVMIYMDEMEKKRTSLIDSRHLIYAYKETESGMKQVAVFYNRRGLAEYIIAQGSSSATTETVMNYATKRINTDRKVYGLRLYSYDREEFVREFKESKGYEGKV